jgi:lipoyl-dependent peroxiredoxin
VQLQEVVMAIRTSEAEWRGTLREGQGRMKLGSGAFEGEYSFPSRFESGQGTNPEELIGAAHAGCFSMALAAALTKAGHAPTRVHTVARVHLDKVDQGFAITTIDLETDAEVSGIDEAAFQREAQSAKQNCPVSKALQGVTINLTARLAP